MPKITLPSQLEEIIKKWQLAMATLREPVHEFPVILDLATLNNHEALQAIYQELNEATGIDHRANAMETYNNNVAFILDYTACYIPDLLKNMLGAYEKDFTGIIKAGANVPYQINNHFDPIYCYLDPQTSVPHINSHRVYLKVQWLEWLFTRVSVLINAKENQYHRITKSLVNLFIKKRLATTIHRLNDYAVKHPDVKRFTVDELEKLYDQPPKAPQQPEEEKHHELVAKANITVEIPEEAVNNKEDELVEISLNDEPPEEDNDSVLPSTSLLEDANEEAAPLQSFWGFLTPKNWANVGRSIYHLIDPTHSNWAESDNDSTSRADTSPIIEKPLPVKIEAETIEPVQDQIQEEQSPEPPNNLLAEIAPGVDEGVNAFVPLPVAQPDAPIVAQEKQDNDTPMVHTNFLSDLNDYKKSLMHTKQNIPKKTWFFSPTASKKPFATKIAAIDKFLLFQANRPVNLNAEDIEHLKDKAIIKLIQHYSPAVKIPREMAKFIPDQNNIDEAISQLQGFIAKTQFARVSQLSYQSLWHSVNKSSSLTIQVNAASKLVYLLSGRDTLPNGDAILLSPEEEKALKKDGLGDLIKDLEKSKVQLISILLAGSQVPKPEIKQPG